MLAWVAVVKRVIVASGIVIILSCDGSAIFKVVSYASAVAPSKTIPVPPICIPDVEVPEANVKASSVVPVVKVLFVNVSLPVNVAGSEPIVNVTA